MEINKFEYGGYTFILKIGDVLGTRFQNEGVIQDVKLSVNDYVLIENNYGVEHNSYYFRLEGKDKKEYIHEDVLTLSLFDECVYVKVSDNYFITMCGEIFHQFMDWINVNLSSKQIKRSKKLQKIINKIKSS
jgi:hypothetical protein